MPFIANERYFYIPPGGEAQITLLGGQEYSPGQPRQNTIWRFIVPEEYAARLTGNLECASFAEARQTLARVFVEGDVSKVKINNA